VKQSRVVRLLLAVVVAVAGVFVVPAVRGSDSARAATITLPAGFQNQEVLSGGLSLPTNFAFSPDGRVFVIEKRGLVKVFDGLDDPTPSVFADLTTNVFNYSDKGLLGLALAPNFPADPYVYVSYSYDAPIHGTAPRWGDTCPTPPNALQDGCVTSARLSRLRANGNVAGPEEVLIEDWCSQFPSHSVGSIAFGSDGALYVGAGEGAGFNSPDYGQYGGSMLLTPTPRNPCGDPPGGVGGEMTPPTAEGGALRAQDLLTASDATTLDGSIARVDPETGDPLPDNPNAGATDENARRIVAHGMRNPFRFTFRPGTTDLWIGDVGWSAWEEINRLPDARAGVRNFGWPCFEGSAPQPGYQAAGLAMCQALYNTPSAVSTPVYQYRHGEKTVPADPNDRCGTSGGSVSGLAFYNGGSLPGPVGTYPARYDGALFFADFSRLCISVMLAGADGLPDPTKVEAFASDTGIAAPVAIHTGPGGDLYWLDLGGTINRIRYFPNNRPPQARLRSDATSGSLPLTVHFDAGESTDPDGDVLAYQWDLDGDGAFDDATGVTAQRTFTDMSPQTVRVLVSDTLGASSTAQVVVTPGNTAPAVQIDAPLGTLRWRAGDTVSFSASANDAEDGPLPASAFDWQLTLLHCPDVENCHQHPVENFHGVSSGTFVAPDHEYPSRLRLDVVVADSGGVTASQSVEVLPATTTLTVDSNVAGAALAIDSEVAPGPFTRTVIVNSNHVVSAPLQQVNGTVYDFDKWSDNGAQAHTVTVPSARSLTATLSPRTVRGVDALVDEPPLGSTVDALVPVRLDKKATRPVTVEWQAEGGTADGNDFTPVSGAVVLPPGSTEQTISVPVRGDIVPEGDETFTVRLSAPQNANLGKSLVTVTIQSGVRPNADAGPDQNVAVGGAVATLDGSASDDPAGLPLTYEWVQIDGPVAVIEDRNSARARVRTPPGASAMTFRLTVTNAAGLTDSDDVTVRAPK
jgi:glucose/arabinose dehydrogenase/PKD repeat protein